MKRLVLALAISCTALPASAIAAPIYLDCTFDTKASPIKLTLDEQTGNASVAIPSNGNSFSMPASFGPSKVLFNQDGIFYDLDRVTLKFVRTVRAYGFVDTGTCTVIKAPKRAI